MPSAATVQPHPLATRLADECAVLRDEFVSLTAERDRLVTTDIPAVTADYQLKIGAAQYALFCRECELRRLKRKAELIQAALNRMEPVSLAMIDAALDEELAAWNRQMAELAEKLKEARWYADQPKHTEEDSAELLRLYRTLAKRLHPDLNPDQDPAAKQLWLRVGEAYRQGDLNGLRAAALVLEDIPKPSLPSALEVLRELREKLKTRISTTLAELSSLKSAFPLNQRENLADAAWVASEVAVREERAAEVNQRIAEVSGLLAAFMGGLAGESRTDNH